MVSSSNSEGVKRKAIWTSEWVSRHQYLILAGITLLAALLRFYKLGEWSFWSDEVFSISGREDGFNYSIFRRSISLDLIRVITSWLGANEWSARLVPALIGILTVPILYFFVKRVFIYQVALLSAALLAVNPWHLYWSQNARFYTALLLLYSMALFLFYLGIEEDRPYLVVASLLLFGLAVKERLLAIFLIPVIVSYLVIVKWGGFLLPSGFRWRNVLIFFIPGLALGLLFINPFLLNIKAWVEAFGKPNNSPVWILASTIYYIGLPVACMGFFAGIKYVVERRRGGLIVSLGALVPILAIMILAGFHYTANRYIFLSLACWIVLAGLAIWEILLHSGAHNRIMAIGVVILVFGAALSEVYLYFQYQNGNRENWKAAYAYVQAHKQLDDLVVGHDLELGKYYMADPINPFEYLVLPNSPLLEGRLWIVEGMNDIGKYPSVHDWVVRNTKQVASFPVYFNARSFTVNVYYYSSSSSPP
jgi:mannosyltransferase